MTFKKGQKVSVLVYKPTDLWCYGTVIKETKSRVLVDTDGVRTGQAYYAKHNVKPE